MLLAKEHISTMHSSKDEVAASQTWNRGVRPGRGRFSFPTQFAQDLSHHLHGKEAKAPTQVMVRFRGESVH